MLHSRYPWLRTVLTLLMLVTGFWLSNSAIAQWYMCVSPSSSVIGTDSNHPLAQTYVDYSGRDSSSLHWISPPYSCTDSVKQSSGMYIGISPINNPEGSLCISFSIPYDGTGSVGKNHPDVEIEFIGGASGDRADPNNYIVNVWNTQRQFVGAYQHSGFSQWCTCDNC